MATATEPTAAQKVRDIEDRLGDIQQLLDREERNARLDGRKPDIDVFIAEQLELEAALVSARAAAAYEAAAPAREAEFSRQERILFDEAQERLDRILDLRARLAAELDASSQLSDRILNLTLDQQRPGIARPGLFRSHGSGAYICALRARNLRSALDGWLRYDAAGLKR